MRPSIGPGSKPCVLSASCAARVSAMATRSLARSVLDRILSLVCANVSFTLSLARTALSLTVSFTSSALSLIVSLALSALSLIVSVVVCAHAGPRDHIVPSASAAAMVMNLCMVVHLLQSSSARHAPATAAGLHREAAVAEPARPLVGLDRRDHEPMLGILQGDGCGRGNTQYCGVDGSDLHGFLEARLAVCYLETCGRKGAPCGQS